jgi:hypothetical protein
MNAMSWRLALFLSRSLDPAERDAVLGDLTESEATGLRAFREIIGLAARRQAESWRDWRPWLALIAIVGPAAITLCLSSVALWGSYDLYLWIGRNYREIDPAILRETHLSLMPGIALTLGGTVLIACVAWTTGFLIGALSRRTIWVNGTLFYALTGTLLLYGGGGFSTGVRILQALAVLPSLSGIRLGFRPSNRPIVRWLLWAAAILAVIGYQRRMWWPVPTGWHLQPLLLVRYLPLLYLLSTANWRRRLSSMFSFLDKERPA